MTMKHASWMVMAAACLGLLAGPAMAQGAPSGGEMKNMPMTSSPKKPMKAKAKAAKPKKMAMAKAKRTCMDYAWQSQDEKDCEAGKIKPPNWR